MATKKLTFNMKIFRLVGERRRVLEDYGEATPETVAEALSRNLSREGYSEGYIEIQRSDSDEPFEIAERRSEKLEQEKSRPHAKFEFRFLKKRDKRRTVSAELESATIADVVASITNQIQLSDFIDGVVEIRRSDHAEVAERLRKQRIEAERQRAKRRTAKAKADKPRGVKVMDAKASGRAKGKATMKNARAR